MVHRLLRWILTVAVAGASLPAQATTPAGDQAARVMQSDSWRQLIAALQNLYLQEPNLLEVEASCRAALSLADDPGKDDAPLIELCLAAAMLRLPVAGGYITATTAEAGRVSSTPSPFGSIGIEIGQRQAAASGPIVVASPLANSPAERAGIRPGDRILEIDGRDITNLPLDEALLGFRGAPGSLAHLRLTRGKDQQMLTLDVKREVIRISHARSRLLEKDAVWVRVSHFGKSAAEDLARQLAHQQSALQGRMPPVLIMDLRACPGGSLVELQQALSIFLPLDTPIGWSRSRTETTVIRSGALSLPTADGISSGWREVPLIVLVDDKTASGAELFAQALRQHRSARLVGSRTAGIATIDQLVALPNGARLRVPTARILAVDKSSWEEAGLAPDVQFEAPGHAEYGAADDAILLHALQLLAPATSRP